MGYLGLLPRTSFISDLYPSLFDSGLRTRLEERLDGKSGGGRDLQGHDDRQVTTERKLDPFVYNHDVNSAVDDSRGVLDLGWTVEGRWRRQEVRVSGMNSGNDSFESISSSPSKIKIRLLGVMGRNFTTTI